MDDILILGKERSKDHISCTKFKVFFTVFFFFFFKARLKLLALLHLCILVVVLLILSQFLNFFQIQDCLPSDLSRQWNHPKTEISTRFSKSRT